MDEMIINGKLMKGLISRIISKFVLKKTGIPIMVQINDFSMRMENGKAMVRADVYSEMAQNDLNKHISLLFD